MRRPSAFGKDSNYQTYVGLGKEIVNTRNRKELSLQITQFTGANVIESQRAASVLHHVSDGAPELLATYVKEFISVLNRPVHDSGPRLVFRILLRIKIPENQLGSVIDLAFQFLNDVNTPVATKVNTLYLIGKYADPYPELITELSASIQSQYIHQPHSFKACVRKLSKQLNQQLAD